LPPGEVRRTSILITGKDKTVPNPEGVEYEPLMPKTYRYLVQKRLLKPLFFSYLCISKFYSK